MVTVVLDNSYSKVIGLSPAQFKGLSTELSYIVGGKNAYFSGYGPRRKSLLDKRGDFPSGLKWRVFDFFKTMGIQYTISDKRKKP